MYLEMEMKKNDHFTITGLVKCMFDVVVKNVNFVSSNACVLEPVCVRLEDSAQPLLDNVGTNVQVF